MTISFNEIPDNVRTPLFFVEFDPSRAGGYVQNSRSLLVGQMLAAGTADSETPMLVSTPEQAKEYFGRGSMLAAMMDAYRKVDDFAEVWCVGVEDDGAGTAATKTVTFGGPATAAGAVPLYIAGQRVRIAVAKDDTDAEVAAAAVDAINANADLPVTAAAVAEVVTLTARHKGALGNGIDVRVAYLGAAGGEALPAGVTVAIADGVAGATDPDVSAAFAALGDDEYDWIGCPYTDTANLDAVKEAMGADGGRWSWNRQIFGHVFSGFRGTLAENSTLGNARNDQHVSVMGAKASPSPVWEWAAVFAARAGKFLSIDPARPVQTGIMNGIKAPAKADRFIQSERNTLLYDGISTFTVDDDGTVRVENAITTYQQNAYGQADDSYLEVTTLATLMEVIRRMRSVVTSKYARSKVADDGTAFGDGQAIVTPNIIRAELIAQYAAMVEQGLVENLEAFKAALIVERNADNPNRIDVLYAPDLVNQLRIFAVNTQFRLNYPRAA